VFVKGKSGNPSGRPKVDIHIRDLARSHSPEAFDRLLTLMRSDDERVALSAIEQIHNRAHGKAPQAMTGEDGEGPAELIVRWLQQSE
jgi:hypothetical protein